jgi:hypothetical protein
MEGKQWREEKRKNSSNGRQRKSNTCGGRQWDENTRVFCANV